MYRTHPVGQGHTWELLIKWNTGEETWEPLRSIEIDDPVTVAKYAHEKGLTDQPGWKRFKSLAKKQQTLLRAINQSQLRQTRRAVKYKFGYQIPRTYEEAIKIDRKNGNTKFQDAVKPELSQIDEYNTFKDIGIAVRNSKGQCTNGPRGYKRITVHLVFDVKHD